MIDLSNSSRPANTTLAIAKSQKLAPTSTIVSPVAIVGKIRIKKVAENDTRNKSTKRT